MDYSARNWIGTACTGCRYEWDDRCIIQLDDKVPVLATERSIRDEVGPNTQIFVARKEDLEINTFKPQVSHFLIINNYMQ